MARTEVERLLDITSGTHGFWLINHQEVIKDDLTRLLQESGGLHTAIKKLNDYRSDFVERLYNKIEASR